MSQTELLLFHNGELVSLSEEQTVIDYTVAYDTIYWLNLNSDVWCSNWQDSKVDSKLFCKDAIDVSPFTDEGEGAIVTPERANWDAYGLPVYSPYGTLHKE